MNVTRLFRVHACLWRLSGALMLLGPAGALQAAQEARLQQWEQDASADLPAPAAATLSQIEGTQRQLLALRSYLRAGSLLSQHWSWSADRIAAYPSSREGQAATVDLDAVNAAFMTANPGYRLQVNRQPRSLESQLQHWNQNASVLRAAGALARDLQRRFAVASPPSAQALRSALMQWTPSQPVALAAPGLSAHGQARAFDFQIFEGTRIVASLDYAAAPRQWDAAGWTEKLQRAVMAAGNHFVGPLASPYEPWHYAYVGASAAIAPSP